MVEGNLSTAAIRIKWDDRSTLWDKNPLKMPNDPFSVAHSSESAGLDNENMRLLPFGHVTQSFGTGGITVRFYDTLWLEVGFLGFLSHFKFTKNFDGQIP